LALKQTELVIEALKRVDPSVDIEVVGITTKGDRQIRPTGKTIAPNKFTSVPHSTGIDPIVRIIATPASPMKTPAMIPKVAIVMML
jgi:hypothetical protein